MKFIYVLLLPIFGIGLCTDNKHVQSNGNIIIEGHIKGIPDGKVYLTESHRWQTPLDSTQIRDGHFVFSIEPDSGFVPFPASILYHNDLSPTKVSIVLFLNEYIPSRTPEKFKHYSYGAFYVEKGKTVIQEDTTVGIKGPIGVFAKITAGKETELMYRNQFTNFGWLGNIDSSSRKQKLLVTKKEILKFPFSYFLLEEIFNAKDQYSKDEIAELFSLFNPEVQNSKTGNKLSTYVKTRLDENEAIPNLTLFDQNNNRHNLVKDSKINMLVFWASWCGPCRQEIPVLKELYSLYKGKGVNMMSISIDSNQESWQKALMQEKMNWTQLIVDSANIETVQYQLNFSAIPFIVLVDRNGKVKKRFTGNENDSMAKLKSAVDEILSEPKSP